MYILNNIMYNKYILESEALLSFAITATYAPTTATEQQQDCHRCNIKFKLFAASAASAGALVATSCPDAADFARLVCL